MIKIVKFLKKEKNILYSLLLSTLFFCIISFAYIVKIESVKSKNILFFPATDVAYDNNSFLDYLSKHDYDNIFVQIKEANTEKTKYCKKFSLTFAKTALSLNIEDYIYDRNLKKFALQSQRYCLDEFTKNIENLKYLFYKDRITFLEESLSYLDTYLTLVIPSFKELESYKTTDSKAPSALDGIVNALISRQNEIMKDQSGFQVYKTIDDLVRLKQMYYDSLQVMRSTILVINHNLEINNQNPILSSLKNFMLIIIIHLSIGIFIFFFKLKKN